MSLAAYEASWTGRAERHPSQWDYHPGAKSRGGRRWWRWVEGEQSYMKPWHKESDRSYLLRNTYLFVQTCSFREREVKNVKCFWLLTFFLYIKVELVRSLNGLLVKYKTTKVCNIWNDWLATLVWSNHLHYDRYIFCWMIYTIHSVHYCWIFPQVVITSVLFDVLWCKNYITINWFPFLKHITVWSIIH